MLTGKRERKHNQIEEVPILGTCKLGTSRIEQKLSSGYETGRIIFSIYSGWIVEFNNFSNHFWPFFYKKGLEWTDQVVRAVKWFVL